MDWRKGRKGKMNRWIGIMRNGGWRVNVDREVAGGE